LGRRKNPLAIRINLYVKDRRLYQTWKRIVEIKGISPSNRLEVLILEDLKHFLSQAELLRKMGEGRTSKVAQSSTEISRKESPSTLPSPNSKSLNNKKVRIK